MLRKISEERTRKEVIDPQLEQAGWYLRDHSKVKIEIPVGVTIKSRGMEFRITSCTAKLGGRYAAGGWAV